MSYPKGPHRKPFGAGCPSTGIAAPLARNPPVAASRHATGASPGTAQDSPARLLLRGRCTSDRAVGADGRVSSFTSASWLEKRNGHRRKSCDRRTASLPLLSASLRTSAKPTVASSSLIRSRAGPSPVRPPGLRPLKRIIAQLAMGHPSAMRQVSYRCNWPNEVEDDARWI